MPKEGQSSKSEGVALAVKDHPQENEKEDEIKEAEREGRIARSMD